MIGGFSGLVEGDSQGDGLLPFPGRAVLFQPQGEGRVFSGNASGLEAGRDIFCGFPDG